jgi:enoyl-CoA hydratase
MGYEILKIEVAAGIATVTVSRPKAMNALNSQFFSEMEQWLAEVKTRPDVRIMILTGEGKAFVAGADIAEMVDMSSQQAREFSQKGQHTFRHLELLEIPVIAAVNGFALGGGCELAMACDIRIASNKAKFGQPEVNLGLIPGYAGTQRLPRLVGLGNALHLLFTGDMIDADTALRMGLVQKVTEPEKLLAETREIAQKIAAKGPMAIRLVKKVVREGVFTDFETGCHLEATLFGAPFGVKGKEGHEGMTAFLEKRQPVW